ncbi:hypothetical protein OPS25_02485 [Alteromonas ponticola]|uniref:Prepilin-type N-terminal cleavage/methylation domain-containing protein n=1 Tax=Alteromonas aquimaris TaxID=2998417 RepID=A0ABT3P3P4_9ALTE|nr:hypothetical protein [Alteromonas aquimaris]MCW8107368.1 hypothetical protein [Alteromonas aquimaris]
MGQAGFSYIELSITSAVVSISALGLLSLITNMNSSTKELNLINHVREQAQGKVIELMAKTEISPSFDHKITKIEESKFAFSTNVTVKQSTLTDITITSSQPGQYFDIKHTISITQLRSPPLTINSVHQLNAAYKPN